MRRMARLYAHDAKGMIPRMSWSPHNLYNLIARSTVPANVAAVSFKNVNSTMYQQRWRAKRFLRGYHGDWIGERRFRRWYLPTTMPKMQPLQRAKSQRGGDVLPGEERAMTEKERLPITGLFLREVERRLDTSVFRCCFARSAREARSLIVTGKVKVNGVRNTVAGTLLNPGDLISVDPVAIPLLSETLAEQARNRKAKAKIAEQNRANAAKAELVPDQQNITSGQSPLQEDITSVDEKQPPEEGSQALDNNTGEDNVGAQQEQNPSDTVENEIDGQAEAAAEHAKEAVEASQSGIAKSQRPTDEAKENEPALPPGVRPFTLPPFAAPFLFIPPYLEVSFTTCSAIYLRHPIVTANPRMRDPQQPQYLSDIPSPYPATGEIFSLAWELYAHDAPRIRSDVRRLQAEARFGRSGLRTARAKDQWRKVLAIRRKRDRDTELSPSPQTLKRTPTEFLVGGRTAAVRRPHVAAAAA